MRTFLRPHPLGRKGHQILLLAYMGESGPGWKSIPRFIFGKHRCDCHAIVRVVSLCGKLS